MTTLRRELQDCNFDFGNGIILYQPVTDDEDYEVSPGWAEKHQLEKGILIQNDHEVLDKDFDDGYGSPQMPRFFAKDKDRFYFPSEYDGSTRIVTIPTEITGLIGSKDPFPYV